MASMNSLRLASFDGGGAQSFSQLEIMGTIMHQLKWERYPNEPDKVMLPSEHFDLIGGSETGGLIAIMFAKLRMSVEEVSDEFFIIFEKVYKNDDFTASNKTSKLKECLEELLTRKKLPLDLKLVEEKQEGACAGFVVASFRINAASKVCLRTYSVRSQPSSAITVIDAILATCATQPDFAPVSSGTGYRKEEYIGAGLGASNPIREVITEAHSLFGGDSTVAFLLSLGSGHPGNICFPPAGVQAETHSVLRDLKMNSQRVAQEVYQQLGRVGIYFRFSVEQGMQEDQPGQADDIGWITSQTKGYLIEAETIERVDACAKTMEAQIGLISLDQLKYTGGPKAVYKGAPMLATHYVKRPGPRNSIIDGITGRGQGQTIVIVTGMAGCGKTQLITDLVLEFGSEQRSDYEYVFFVDGSTKSSIEGDLIGHVKLTLPGSPQIGLKDAMSFFQSPRNSKWLIAFDNVDDIDLDFRPFIPQCNQGTVVVTTRNHSLGQLASEPHLHLKLDVMSEEEAIEVILRCARITSPSNEEQVAVAVIAEKLGHLPVALSQAGCYMYEASCSANTYIELLDKYRPQMMDKPSSGRQRDCAYAAFDISYHRLPKGLKNVVHLLSFFHFANFPEGIIPHAAKTSFRMDPIILEQRDPRFEESIQLLHETFIPNGGWSDLTLPEMARLLQSYSIISVTSMPDTNLWRIHPLLREWAFDRLHNRDVFRDAACRLVVRDDKDIHLMMYLPAHIESIMARPVDSPICINDSLAMATTVRVMSQNPKARKMITPLYTSVVEKYGPDDLKVATISLELAETLDVSPDELLEADKLQSDAVRIRAAILGSNHIDTIEAEIDLSQTLYFRDKLLASQDLLEDILKRLDTQLGDIRLHSLYAMHFLSRIHQKQHRFAEAETLQVKVVEGYKTQVGFMHPYTLTAMSDHASIHSDLGRYSEAEALQVKVLEARRVQLGDSHKDTLVAMTDLACSYHNQGRYSEAESLHAKVLDLRKAQLGHEHLDTLASMSNLASVYQEQARYSEAEGLHVEVLDARTIQLGDSHGKTLAAMGNLACNYHKQGRYSEAEALEVKVLDGLLVQLGDSHRDTLNAMNNLAWTYHQQGRYPEAEPLHAKVLDLRKAQLGHEHLDTLASMSNLASVYQEQARYSEAEGLQVEVLDACTIQLGDSHGKTLAAMANLACNYRKQGRYSEAEALDVKVLDAHRMQLGDSHEETLNAMGYLAQTYCNQRRYLEAEALDVKVLDARRMQLGDSHAKTLHAMDSLAWTYYQRGRYSEAEALQVQVLDAHMVHLGASHEKTLTAMTDLARSYRKQRRYADAEALVVKALDTRRVQLGDSDDKTLNEMRDLARIYYNQGRYSEAEALDVKVLDARRMQLGDSHAKTLHAMDNLAWTYYRRGLYSEAEALQVQVLDAHTVQLGASHEKTLAAMANLARNYRKQRRYLEARTFEVKVLAASRAQLGE